MIADACIASQTAGDLARAFDPVLFAESLGIAPDPWQRDVLRSESNRILLNCGRQVGKSTCAALLALHQAIYSPGSLVLLYSPSLRQSAELFRTVSRLYGLTGAAVPADALTLLRLELQNGSRVLSLPGSESTTRGFAGVDLLVLDEAALVPDDLYLATLPMIATKPGARIVAASTPRGRRGWWAEAWHNLRSPWERVTIASTECPRIGDAYLAEQREAMGASWFAQEFLCSFEDSDTAAFRDNDILHAQLETVTQWTL